MMKLLYSFLAGALLTCAFAPYELYPLAVISLFLLLLLWEKTSPREAFKHGLFFGFGFFGCGIHWIYLSIHNYGNPNIFIGGSITGLLILFLSLFPALIGYCFNKFYSEKKLHYWLAFPAMWALSEWIRSWIFTGFPWLLLGHSQIISPLSGFAPIVGVYGESFIIALSAGLLITSFRQSKKYLSILLLVSLWLLGFGLSYINWTKPINQPIKVSLIQGDIPITLKWTPDYAMQGLNIYKKLTLENAKPGTLVIWPETAVTILLQSAIPLLENFDNDLAKQKISVITGIPIPQSDDPEDNYFNGAIVLGAGGGHYFKRHLVPFGEYTPLENILGKLLKVLNLPMSDFIAGPQKQTLMHANNLYIAPYICYEIAYSNLLKTDLPQANLLVTISNDSWFGESWALAQHRQIAQFASLMTGRYMLVASNSGETVIINPKGKLLAEAPLDLTVALNAEVSGMEGSTPWTKLGNLPFIILFILILLIR